MTKILRILIIALVVCGCSTIQKKKSVEDEKSADNYVSNISLVDGKYKIDTNAILNNNNLQSLIEKLEKTELNEKKTVAEIPTFIKSFLDSLTDNFSIANPGEYWQVGCTVMGKQIQKKVYDKVTRDTLIEVTFVNSQPLPSRQLIYLEIGKDIALMTYYTGGIGVSEHIIIIKFDDNKIIDFWCGNILTDVLNKAEILKYLNDNKDKHWGLNTNIIYL